MSDLVATVLGIAIIVAVGLDIFRSLLLPRASTRFLRVAPLLTTALFSAWQAVADRIPRRDVRQTVRASLAPLMLVLTFCAWAGLLVVGFGLLFWADRDNFSDGFETFGDAAYAAGAALSTLGVNGTVTGNYTRIVVLICSISGLAIVTVVATFLISIQSGFTRRETLVLRLESHVTLPPAGIAILETYARERIVSRLAAFFDAWEVWTAEVAITHRAYPIMVFFRSNDDRCEWLAALGAVLDAAALVDSTLDDVAPEVRASTHFVLRTGARALRDMARQFAGTIDETQDIADRDRFRDHRERLQAVGYAIRADEDRSLATFIERRRSYAYALAALATRLRIDVDERTSDDEDSRPLAS
jgi:hypothetical protein